MGGIDGVISVILTENRKVVCPVALVGAEMFSRIQNPIYCLPSTVSVLRWGENPTVLALKPLII